MSGRERLAPMNDDTLRPLRIPSGWCVRHNGLFAIEDSRWAPSEDLLWLEEVDVVTGAPTGRFLGLGWYGGLDEGTYRLVMMKDDWAHELERHEARDREAIVRVLEAWLARRR